MDCRDARSPLDPNGVRHKGCFGTAATGSETVTPYRGVKATSEPVAASPTPYVSYATILAGFGGTLAATAALERALGREVRPASALDLMVLCAGSFKAARSLSRERVGRVLRQPFVEASADADVAHELPAGDGLQRALGELVTCTRCIGTWTAAGLLTCQAIAPRFGRLLTWSLAAGAGNDFLQAGFAALIARELPDARDRPQN